MTDAEKEAPPAAEAPETKRPAEEDAEQEPEAKRPRSDDGDAPAAPSEPVAIGYRTYSNGTEAYKYYHGIMSKYRKNQDLNEYEFHNVMELIRVGHPEAERKLATPVGAIQIREVYTRGVPSTCFHLLRSDGGTEDVSYRKCIANLFPEMKDLVAGQTGGGGEQRSGSGGRRGGRGGGRGGGRRGGGRGRGKR